MEIWNSFFSHSIDHLRYLIYNTCLINSVVFTKIFCFLLFAVSSMEHVLFVAFSRRYFNWSIKQAKPTSVSIIFCFPRVRGFCCLFCINKLFSFSFLNQNLVALQCSIITSMVKKFVPLSCFLNDLFFIEFRLCIWSFLLEFVNFDGRKSKFETAWPISHATLIANGFKLSRTDFENIIQGSRKNFEILTLFLVSKKGQQKFSSNYRNFPIMSYFCGNATQKHVTDVLMKGCFQSAWDFELTEVCSIEAVQHFYENNNFFGDDFKELEEAINIFLIKNAQLTSSIYPMPLRAPCLHWFLLELCNSLDMCSR